MNRKWVTFFAFVLAIVLTAFATGHFRSSMRCEILRHDRLRWNIPPEQIPGFCDLPEEASAKSRSYELVVDDSFQKLAPERWSASTHTFTCNDAAFSPENVVLSEGGGIKLKVEHKPTGIKPFGAAELATKDGPSSFLYGRFSARLKPAAVSGVISSFFLYRFDPWQEIDMEFAGKDTSKLLINVFYNPGKVGDHNNDGVTGTPVLIPLGFDASMDFHDYMIEWSENEIRWLVDGKLIHRRTSTGPSPIPGLPMRLIMNAWPTCSEELGGKFDPKNAPLSAEVKSVRIYRELKL